MVGGPAKRDSAHRRVELGTGAMKLNSAQLERALNQFEAGPFPRPSLIQRLNDLFGEHTFFARPPWAEHRGAGSVGRVFRHGRRYLPIGAAKAGRVWRYTSPKRPTSSSALD